MEFIILRLDAPLVSFGSVLIDQHGPVDRFPGTSMLTGILANALGWSHGDFDLLQGLQDRLRYAARWDVAPAHAIDYQTADLGQEKMRKAGWTTRMEPEYRKGGDAKRGIAQRYRHYWTDGLMTVALTLDPPGGEPLVTTLLNALSMPARPLFIGRKACLPSRPLLDPELPLIKAGNALEALLGIPLWNRYGQKVPGPQRLEACWPADIDYPDGKFELKKVYDKREWASQLPAGDRIRAEGLMEVD